MNIRKSLDAAVNNLFKGHATIIGEWATASHVERQGGGWQRKRRWHSAETVAGCAHANGI